MEKINYCSKRIEQVSENFLLDIEFGITKIMKS